MAKDITIRVTGQNADGTLNVQQIDGSNPFMSQSSTSMVAMGQPSMVAQQQQQQQVGYRARIGSVDVTFATEADYLKADRALREMAEAQNVPAVGGLAARSIGSSASWLRTGANAAEAVGAFLNGRNIRRKLEDLDNSLTESRDARAELDVLERGNAVLAPLIPTLRRLFLAERDATEASISVLEDQLTAVDIQAGSGVAKVAADLMGNAKPSAGEGSGLGTAVAVGGAGLGLGLLLSNNRESSSSTRRRRR